ncbi:hypothetical protein QR665_04650 [Acinetobacter gerneri]|uniref:toxin-antitoxin system YwqK family antitoxin n=1 Tax=Acinetobacter gerneri TaxID=202952 RepID=UPI002935749A|nr:hypothetical protein [Acinetobacter gerneri]MDV2438784.1 hypothetical protein [Acinetobacter gerneri]
MKLFQYTIIGVLLCASFSSYADTKPSFPDENFNKINHKNEPIIAYFIKEKATQECNCDTTFSMTPTEDGKYRKLLGRTTEGYYRLQDFYSQNNNVASSEFLTKSAEAIFHEDYLFLEGNLITYYKNGQILFSANFKEDKLVGDSKRYYSNGQLYLLNRIDDQNIHYQKVWYPNGKDAMEFTWKDDKDFNFLLGRFWDKNGKKVIDNDKKLALLEAFKAEIKMLVE